MHVSRNAVCNFLIFSLLSAGWLSCSKKDQHPANSAADIQTFQFIPGEDYSKIFPADHTVSLISGNTFSGKQLAAHFTLSPGATASINGVQQVSGVTLNDFDQPVTYTITAADQRTKQAWSVSATNNSNTVDYGMGYFINAELSNNRSYNWYIDQATSGTYASVNCGPASVTMAIRWADSTFSHTALDARKTFHPEGGWWYTNDIDAYLTQYGISHAIIGLANDAATSGDLIKKQLDHHQIVILCLDMDHVRHAGGPNLHADKFYETSPGWGHFIVLKGYRRVDGKLFFEVFDPYSFGNTYSDMSLKGLDRYYRYEDLAAACLPWWNFAFVIAAKGEQLSTDASTRRLDPAKVPVAHNF